jgi:hypothetical protein
LPLRAIFIFHFPSYFATFSLPPPFDMPFHALPAISCSAPSALLMPFLFIFAADLFSFHFIFRHYAFDVTLSFSPLPRQLLIAAIFRHYFH